MDVLIERIVNDPISSNCYVLYTGANSPCLVIDPGTQDCLKLFDFIRNKGLMPEYIILTHEHFDHIWGVNKIVEEFGCKIICSSSCSNKITSKKGNMSVFYDNVGFETPPGDILIENILEDFFWNNKQLRFLNTRGHTSSSISIVIENSIFVGDLIIKGLKTVTKLPTGCKDMLKESISYLVKHVIKTDTIVYPGHGEQIAFGELNFSSQI